MKHKLFIIFAFIALCACTPLEEDTPKARRTNSNPSNPFLPSGMCYTSPTELSALYSANTSNVIHFNVARIIASAELMAGAISIYGCNEPWQLTQLPKVVYNYDNSPKYYEFGLIIDGNLSGTITTFAQKEIAGVIAYALPLLDYSCDSVDYYIGNYPNRYYGTGGICYLKNCDEPLSETELYEFAATDEEERENMFLMMDQDDINGILDDCNEEGSDIDLTDEIAERDAYWETIDNYIAEHPDILDFDNLSVTSLSTEAFAAHISGGYFLADDETMIADIIEELDYAVGYCNTFTLQQYSNPRLQATHWSGFCGPAACAWVYRGKYDSYNNHYLPICGDGNHYNNDAYFYDYYTGEMNNSYAWYNISWVDNSESLGMTTALYNYGIRSYDADYGLTACFYNETFPFVWDNEWQFPLFHGGLNRGFNTATNGVYKVKLTCNPLKALAQDHQPMIIAINCNHYIVAFGYGSTLDNSGNPKDLYLMVTDNGLTTSATGYHPYMRKKNFWNLHYKLAYQ